MNPNDIPGLKWILSGAVLVVFVIILYLCNPGRYVIRSEKMDRKREQEMRRGKHGTAEKSGDDRDDDGDSKTVQLDGSFTSQRSSDGADFQLEEIDNADNGEPSTDDIV